MTDQASPPPPTDGAPPPGQGAPGASADSRAPADSGAPAARPRAMMGLSARLLVLTIAFVMLAEFLIYAPSVARYRKNYFEDQLATAQLAAMSLEASPDFMVSRELEERVLAHANAHAIVLRKPDYKVLVLSHDMPTEADLTVDLHRTGFLSWIQGAFATLMQEENRVLRILGPSPRDPGIEVEVVMDEAPLRMALLDFSKRILGLSILISLITATLVYLSLQWLTVRPMRRITHSMMAFRKNPEDGSAIIRPSKRGDEVGFAQRELAVMQRDLRSALTQKSRLAALGAAVAKVNHDLRNTLSTAMLISDRLAMSDDPDVRKITPRLFDAIDRAVVLSSQTLEYVRDEPPRVMKDHVPLAELLEEARAMSEPLFQTCDDEDALCWQVTVDPDLFVWADRNQFVRILQNLARNARQAGASQLRLTAAESSAPHAGGPPRGWVHIYVADDGPGLPEKAHRHLFEPFASSTGRKGGTGLGLAIARDIMRAHGGDIELDGTGPDGTTFRLDLPNQPPEA